MYNIIGAQNIIGQAQHPMAHAFAPPGGMHMGPPQQAPIMPHMMPPPMPHPPPPPPPPPGPHPGPFPVHHQFRFREFLFPWFNWGFPPYYGHPWGYPSAQLITITNPAGAYLRDLNGLILTVIPYGSVVQVEPFSPLYYSAQWGGYSGYLLIGPWTA